MNVVQLAAPFLSSAIIAVLTFDIYRRYQQHKGSHQHLLFWGVGLGMASIASLCGGLLYFGWNEELFIGWFLFGVILDAAWIGQGTLVLLFRRRWVTFTSMILVLLSVVTLIILLSTPFNASQFVTGTSIFEQYKPIMAQNPLIRQLLIFFNIYGTITIVGGALWSSYLFYRKRILPNRVIGNVLIAAGALVIAGAGSLTVSGHPEFHELAQVIFAALTYVGFVFASRPAAVQESERQPQVKVVPSH